MLGEFSGGETVTLESASIHFFPTDELIERWQGGPRRQPPGVDLERQGACPIWKFFTQWWGILATADSHQSKAAPAHQIRASDVEEKQDPGIKEITGQWPEGRPIERIRRGQPIGATREPGRSSVNRAFGPLGGSGGTGALLKTGGFCARVSPADIGRWRHGGEAD